MPTIYLSPSTQESNLYVSGGSEEYYMNLLADAMEPYLRSSGIRFVRNSPDMSAASSIRASNRGNYDLHLALHSNAAPEGRYGQVRGSDVYYAPGSVSGQRAARIFAENLRAIYPGTVRALPTTSIGEVTRTRAPAVFLELAYHDNPEDAAWIVSNLDEIARNLVLSLTEYFGIPFVPPQPIRSGRVRVNSGSLNIRRLPSTNSRVVASAPNGAALTIVGEDGNWYVVEYGNTTGYANKAYVQV